MKILFKENKYHKISDDLEADAMVKKYGYRYATRKEWKENVHDVKKPITVEEKVALTKHQETKQRRAEKRSKIKQNQH